MIDRRMAMLGLLSCTGCATIRGLTQRPALLDRAIARAGGRQAVEAVRMLSWDGRATVHAGDRDIAIGLSTRVAPFDWAQSRSWLVAQGPSKSRTMVITRNDGWVELNGRRTTLDHATIAHERAQYTIYGLMLLAPLTGALAEVEEIGTTAEGLQGLRVRHPAAPVTDLLFDRDARLVEVRNRVPAPDGGAAIDQRCAFTGELVSNGMRWPSALRLEQNGRPYLDLTFDRFEASPVAAEPPRR